MNTAARSITEVSRPASPALGRAVGRSNLMAWSISVLLHAGAFAGFYGVVFQEESHPRLIIPETSFTAAGAVSPAASPVKPLRLELNDARTLHVDAAPADLQMPPVADASLDQAPDVAPPMPSDLRVTDALTSAMPAGAGPLGPASQFFGQAGNAYKIVYVVDVSASLMIYVPDIAREMRRSVEELKPTQEFHIVLARPARVDEFSPKRLVPAIRTYKRAAAAFIETIQGRPDAGKADPIEAMRAHCRRARIDLSSLSDGDYIDIRAELELALRQLNKDGRVHITTIGFNPRPDDLELLKRIARQNGGHCRVVELKE